MATVSACAVASARLSGTPTTRLSRQMRGDHSWARGVVSRNRPPRPSPTWRACHRCVVRGAPSVLLTQRKSLGRARDRPPSRRLAATTRRSPLEEQQRGDGKGDDERNANDDEGTDQKENEASSEENRGEDDLATKVALGLIRFYRSNISPLTPPSCRFVPTCSAYALTAYTKFGPTKGFVLTAWRILRCHPWGGAGYDPPRWPPVGMGKGAGED